MRREKFQREKEVLLTPRLAVEAIFIVRRCEEREREKTEERGEIGERGRGKREGRHERWRRISMTGTTISFFLINFLFFSFDINFF